MDKIYDLEEWVWTEKDFNKMKWHDCNIYAFAFQKNDYKLMFDIDYIFEWVKPTGLDKDYKFWVAPATLVFENVYDLEIEMDCNLSIEIDTICMEQPKKPKNSDYIKKDLEWKWKISTQCGEIRFQSVGYKMYVRSQPLLQQSQEIGFTERGGISFYQGYYAKLN